MCARGETCDEECGMGMDGAVRWWRQAAAWVPERNAKQNITTTIKSRLPLSGSGYSGYPPELGLF